MSETVPISPEVTEFEELENLQFLFQDSSQPQVVVVTWENSRQRFRLMSEIQNRLKDYWHLEVDFTGVQVISLMRELEKRPVMRPVWESPRHENGRLKYVVHIVGLEGTLSVETYQKEKRFLPQLNYERELIFRQVPALLIFWLTPYTYQQLRNQAADFFSWLTLKISLPLREQDITPSPAIPPSTPPPRYTPELEERIKILEEQYAGISWTNKNAEQSGADCQRQLVETFREAQDFKQAEKSWKRRIAHLERLENTEKDQAEAWRGLGDMLLDLAKWDEAATTLLNAKQLFFNINAQEQFGALFNSLGHLYKGKRQWDEALEYFQKSIEWREKFDRFYLGGPYHNIGMVYAEQHKWEEALEYYGKAIELSKAENNLIFLGRHYHQSGLVFTNQRLWKQAFESFQTSIEYKEKSGKLTEISSGLQCIGDVYGHLYQWDNALFYYERALEWNTKYNYQLGLGGDFFKIGMVLTELRRWKQAQKNYESSLDWFEKTGSEFNFGNVYLNIAMLYSRQRQWLPALDNCRLAIKWFEKTDNLLSMGTAYHEIGYVYAEEQVWDKSLENYIKAVEWKIQTNDLRNLGKTYHQIGIIYSNLSQWKSAMENYQKAIEWKQKTGSYFELGSTYHNIGLLLEKQERLEEARTYYEYAVEAAETWGAPPEEKAFFSRSLDKLLNTFFQNINTYAQQIPETTFQEPEFDYAVTPPPAELAKVYLPASVQLRIAQNALENGNYEAAISETEQILDFYSDQSKETLDENLEKIIQAHLLLGITKGKIRTSAGMHNPSAPETEHLRKAYDLAKSSLENGKIQIAGLYLEAAWHNMASLPKTVGNWWTGPKKNNPLIAEICEEALRLTQNINLGAETLKWRDKINQF